MSGEERRRRKRREARKTALRKNHRFQVLMAKHCCLLN